MLKKLIFFLFFLHIYFGYGQQTIQLSKFSEISIVTSGPGKALYEKFGHTAIRVKDPTLQLDLIYNYGMFDFNDSSFIVNFTKGYMKYKLARYPFHYSLRSAQEDGRWMKQQILNLSLEEKNSFFKFLETNSLPQNASYFYDPFFDNCATKPRDIINKVLKNKIIWSNSFTSNKSLRELMNIEIHQNTWGSLGINIALGSKLDKKANPSEYLYLPDYVEKALSLAKIKKGGKQENLIKKTDVLLNFDEKQPKSDIISPFFVFVILLFLGGYITFKDFKNQQRTKWLDFVLFFTTGFTGVLIIFLWFFTNHSTAPNNFNILWGFPVNFIVAFYLVKKNLPSWVSKYNKVLLILLLLIPIVWLTRVQLFNWTLLPFFLLLVTRYLFLQKTLNS